MNDQQTSVSPPLVPLAETPAPQRTIDSRELLQGQKELLITHGTECYRLRLTRSGKLILYK